MPTFNVKCPDCGNLDDVFVTPATRRTAGCVAGETVCSCGKVVPIRWHGAPLKVSTFSSGRDVPGLGKDFKSWREVEKAADAKGKRIMEDSEKRAYREEGTKDSAEYAQQLGYGSRQEYAEARKKNRGEMVATAKAKKMDRAVRKYGSGIRQDVETGQAD